MNSYWVSIITNNYAAESFRTSLIPPAFDTPVYPLSSPPPLPTIDYSLKKDTYILNHLLSNLAHLHPLSHLPPLSPHLARLALHRLQLAQRGNFYTQTGRRRLTGLRRRLTGR